MIPPNSNLDWTRFQEVVSLVVARDGSLCLGGLGDGSRGSRQPSRQRVGKGAALLKCPWIRGKTITPASFLQLQAIVLSKSDQVVQNLNSNSHASSQKILSLNVSWGIGAHFLFKFTMIEKAFSIREMWGFFLVTRA